MTRHAIFGVLSLFLSQIGLLGQTALVGKLQHSVTWAGNDTCPPVQHNAVYTTGSVTFPVSETCKGESIAAQITLQFPDTLSATLDHSAGILTLNSPASASIQLNGKWTVPAGTYTGSTGIFDFTSWGVPSAIPCPSIYTPKQSLPAGDTAFSAQRSCTLASTGNYDWDAVANSYTVTLQSDVEVDIVGKDAFGDEVPSLGVRVVAAITSTYLFTSGPPPPPPPPPVPTLTIDHMEVVQVVQTADNAVPLVARKKTVVRVFPKVPDGAAPLAGVTGLLHGLRDNVELAGSPLVPAKAVITAQPKPQRANAADSLMFVLPEEWSTVGQTQLIAEVAPPGTANANNATLSQTAAFADPPNLPDPFVINYWRLCYQPAGQPERCPSDGVKHFDSALRKLYPLSDFAVIYNQWMSPTKTWTNPLNTKDDVGKFLKMMRKQFATSVNPLLVNQIAAWFPAGIAGNVLGNSDPIWLGGGGHVTFNEDDSAKDPSDPAMTLAHETGHNLGLRHTGTADPCDTSKDSGKPKQWPYATADIREVGIDPFTMEVKSPLMKDMMSYCTPASKLWISAFNYQLLMASQVLARPHSRIRPLDTSVLPSNQIVVSGSAQSDGSSGTLDPAYMVNSQVSADLSDPSGNHCLRFFNAAGPEADFCFTLNFEDPRTLAPLDRDYFVVRAPYPADTARIALVRNGAELASLAVSPDAPQVTITAPQPGDQWSGTQTLYWTASDPSGNPLTYAVQYSSDGGQTWTPMDVDLQSPQYTFDTGQITAGTQVYFQVLATSGVTTGSATVGPITIASAPNLAAAPAALDFGVAAIRQQMDLAVSLDNLGNAPVSITPGNDLQAPFTLLGPGTPFVVPAGGSSNLQIRFNAAVSGTQSGMLTLHTDNPAQPAITIPVIARVAAATDPRIEIPPAVLDFGSLPLGQTGELSLAIRNTGFGTLQITAATASDPQFTVVSPTAPFSIPPGGSAALVVHFTPASAGPQSAQLTLATNDPLFPSDVISLGGTGQAPAVPPPVVITSDTFNRPDAGQNALGVTDLALGGTQSYCYIPVWVGASIVSGKLQNNGKGAGGVQFGQPGSGGSCAFRGQNMGQDFNIAVDVLVPGDSAGNSAAAGPYFRNRAAAAQDGILGGDSAGYWVQLDGAGLVKVVDAHTNTALVKTSPPASFDNTVFHTLQVAVSGSTLQVSLDGALLTFTQGSSPVQTVKLPTTGGSNDGTAGIAFTLASGSGQIAGAGADNLVVTQYQALGPS
jgi:hypothetical protein